MFNTFGYYIFLLEMAEKSKYKLTYFNVRMIAEPIRLILHFVGEEFEDIRVDFYKEWPSIKEGIVL